MGVRSHSITLTSSRGLRPRVGRARLRGKELSV